MDKKGLPSQLYLFFREFDQSQKQRKKKVLHLGLHSDFTTDIYCTIRSTSWNGAAAQFHTQFVQILITDKNLPFAVQKK